MKFIAVRRTTGCSAKRSGLSRVFDCHGRINLRDPSNITFKGDSGRLTAPRPPLRSELETLKFARRLLEFASHPGKSELELPKSELESKKFARKLQELTLQLLKFAFESERSELEPLGRELESKKFALDRPAAGLGGQRLSICGYFLSCADYY